MNEVGGVNLLEGAMMVWVLATGVVGAAWDWERQNQLFAESFSLKWSPLLLFTFPFQLVQFGWVVALMFLRGCYTAHRQVLPLQLRRWFGSGTAGK